jgi:hypothetical protein
VRVHKGTLEVAEGPLADADLAVDTDLSFGA